MAAIETLPIFDPMEAAEEPQVPTLNKRRRFKIRPGRFIVLSLAGIYFLLPLFAAFRFALQNNEGRFSFVQISSLSSQTGLGAAFWLSIRLAFVTVVVATVLVMPTIIYMFLKTPRLKRLFETISLLPIVIPPIVLILGVLEATPLWLKSSPYLLSLMYVVLSLPFIYRSLAAGLEAIDLKTLVEASKSLGAGWIRTLVKVLLPNLRSALLSATVLTIALVLGEFTMASLDLWETLPVWIVDFAQSNGRVTVLVAMLSLVGTWILLTLIVSLDRSQSRRNLSRKQ